MNQRAVYSCRRLGTRELRETYSLALMNHPGMSFAGWRQTIRAALAGKAGIELVVVYNLAQCAIAVVRLSAADVTFVLRPPALLADPTQILAVVQDFFDASRAKARLLSATA
jgi:hypothetical protein